MGGGSIFWRNDLSVRDLKPSPTYTYSPTLVGTILQALSSKEEGEVIVFTGLDTPNPVVSFSESGGTSPMKILHESKSVIFLQLFTGSSHETILVDKTTGLFTRTYAGNTAGVYAGASVGRFK